MELLLEQEVITPLYFLPLIKEYLDAWLLSIKAILAPVSIKKLAGLLFTLHSIISLLSDLDFIMYNL